MVANGRPDCNSIVQRKNTVCTNVKHNNLDTSIKHSISGQSTPMVKGSMNIMFDMVDTAFSY